MIRRRWDSMFGILPSFQMNGRGTLSPLAGGHLSIRAASTVSQLITENNHWRSDQVPSTFRRHFIKGFLASEDKNLKLAINHFRDSIASLPESADPLYRFTAEQHICEIEKQLQLLENASADAVVQENRWRYGIEFDKFAGKWLLEVPSIIASVYTCFKIGQCVAYCFGAENDKRKGQGSGSSSLRNVVEVKNECFKQIE